MLVMLTHIREFMEITELDKEDEIEVYDPACADWGPPQPVEDVCFAFTRTGRPWPYLVLRRAGVAPHVMDCHDYCVLAGNAIGQKFTAQDEDHELIVAHYA